MQTIPICKYHHSESNRKCSRGPYLLSRGYERLDVINKLKLNSRKMKFLLVQKPTSFFPILLALTYALGIIVFSVKEDVWNFSWIHNYFHQQLMAMSKQVFVQFCLILLFQSRKPLTTVMHIIIPFNWIATKLISWGKC